MVICNANKANRQDYPKEENKKLSQVVL